MPVQIIFLAPVSPIINDNNSLWQCNACGQRFGRG